MLPQLSPKNLLDEQDRLECRDVDVVEQPPESPSNPLPGHPEGFVNLLAIRAAAPILLGWSGFNTSCGGSGRRSASSAGTWRRGRRSVRGRRPLNTRTSARWRTPSSGWRAGPSNPSASMLCQLGRGLPRASLGFSDRNRSGGHPRRARCGPLPLGAVSARAGLCGSAGDWLVG